MVRFTSIALSAVLVQIAAGQSIRAANAQSNVARNLSYDRIAGYEPNSKVTDHNALDRDQKFMEIELAKGTTTGIDRAKRIYQEGGNSKSYAEITLDVDLPATIQAKAFVSGKSVGDENETIYGSVMSAEGNQKIVKIQYDTSQNQATWVGCRVGGLNEGRETNGCFKDSGTIVLDGKSYQYTYDSTLDNKNGRTLQGFSTAVESKMLSCGAGCPMRDAKYFADYYGQANYGDLWIQAAFNGRALTNFDYGNTNFNLLGYSAKSELIKKGTVCMNTFMYVIREFEDAIADCKSECDTNTNCNDDPVHAWDEGVAFYAGSLEGLDGYSSGKMLHQLADKRCRNFKTCGLNGDLDGPTTSLVNHELLKLFNRGKEQLLSNQCEAARPTVQAITTLMYIPLIQGTLQYAYFLQTGDRNEKQRAEGAVFSASVVPRVHAMSASAASIISSNMSLEATTTSFSSVKTAFESVYTELGISCRQVGGIVNTEGMYYPGAEPCASRGDDDGMGTGNDDGSDDATSGCSDDKTASDDGSDDDKAASTDDGSDDDKEAATDDGSDDDKEAATDDGTDDDKEAATDDGTDDDKAAADDGTDDDKAAADDGTDDDGAGCSGVGSTGISTIVLLLSMASAFVVL